MISGRAGASGRLPFFFGRSNMPSTPLHRQFLPLFLIVLTPWDTAAGAAPETVLSTECTVAATSVLPATASIKRLPVVRSILIRGEPVFDPSRETLGDQILNGMNRLHWQTRESVIKRQLLFEVGSNLSPAALAESARLLRSRPYLMDAGINVQNPCEPEVDIEVTTRDALSLTPRVALNRSGGNNKTGLGVREKNLLGLGIQI